MPEIFLAIPEILGSIGTGVGAGLTGVGDALGLGAAGAGAAGAGAAEAGAAGAGAAGAAGAADIGAGVAGTGLADLGGLGGAVAAGADALGAGGAGATGLADATLGTGVAGATPAISGSAVTPAAIGGGAGSAAAGAAPAGVAATGGDIAAAAPVASEAATVSGGPAGLAAPGAAVAPSGGAGAALAPAAAPGAAIAPAAGTAAAPAAATGGEGFSLSNLGSTLTKNPSLLLTGGMLAKSLLSGNAKPEGQAALEAQAGKLSAQGNQLQSYLTSGTLPPGVGASLNAAHDAAAATIRSQYASRGMSGSSAEQQDLAHLSQTTVSQGAQIATQLLSQGVSEQEFSAQIYQNLMAASAARDKAMSDSMARFAGALAGGVGKSATSYTLTPTA